MRFPPGGYRKTDDQDPTDALLLPLDPELPWEDRYRQGSRTRRERLRPSEVRQPR
jgi:hypothetical protein